MYVTVASEVGPRSFHSHSPLIESAGRITSSGPWSSAAVKSSIWFRLRWKLRIPNSNGPPS